MYICIHTYTHIHTHISIYLYILNNNWSNLASTLLKANEKELFKTYPKLTKKYQTLNWNIQEAVQKLPRLSTGTSQDAVYLLKNQLAIYKLKKPFVYKLQKNPLMPQFAFSLLKGRSVPFILKSVHTDRSQCTAVILKLQEG